MFGVPKLIARKMVIKRNYVLKRETTHTRQTAKSLV